MKNKGKKLTLTEQIKELKAQIVANSKDSSWATKMLTELSFLQKKSYSEPVEIIVPVKEVKESIDFGACKISHTIRGYLFEAKGGMHTFVDLRMVSICTALDSLFELHAKEDKTEEEKAYYESFSTALLYVFQSPIFACLDASMLFEVAADLLSRFNNYASENLDNTELKDETADDVKANIEFEKQADYMQDVIDAPIPE